VSVNILFPGSEAERALTGEIVQPVQAFRPYPDADKTAVATVVLFLLLLIIAHLTIPRSRNSDERSQNR